MENLFSFHTLLYHMHTRARVHTHTHTHPPPPVPDFYLSENKAVFLIYYQAAAND